MKFKASWFKGFLAGLIVVAMLSAGLAYAAGGMTAVTAYIDSALHMSFNGAAFEPVEADGSAVPVFLYNDRTYLPVRAVAEKAGVYVDYDDDTAEVILKSENSLLSRANLVLHNLKYQDFKQLAPLVHKDKGVTFSPYGFVTGDAINFTAAQLAAIKLTDEYLWGEYDGSGDPMELSVGDYFNDIVYKQDYINAEQIGVNTIVKSGNTLINLKEAFPKASFVEFHFSGFNPEFEGMDWTSLRLVFENAGGQWMLIGVVRDCWTI